MKKRILSLFLAVVMLFSCLSLNVFATEPTAAEPQSSTETVVSDTFDEHTGTEILSHLNSVKTQGTTVAYSDASSSGIVENENVSIKYENGKIVKMGGSAKQSRIQLTDHTNLSGREALQNYTASNPIIGASFVLQATWNFTDAFRGKDENIFQICDYVSSNLGNGYSGNKYIPTTDSVMPNILAVNSSMQLTASVATTNASRSNVVVKQLEKNVDYTFSVFVDPSYVDEATDTYGKFDVYVNGECVKPGLKLFNKYMNDNNFVLDERTPYFNQSAFSDSANKILKSGATVYFFSETAPSAEEAAQILADCGITASGSYTVKATGRTKQGVKDLSIGFVRFQMSSYSYSADAFSVDNIMCYYTEEFTNNFVDHKLVSNHDHDYDKETTDVITTCAFCDGKKVVRATIDANGDRVCDICVGELPVGALMTPTELKNSGITYKVSTEFNGSATWHGQMGANNANVSGVIKLVQDGDNYYVAYGTATKANESGFYAQTNTDAAGRENALKVRDTLKGKAYTVTFDVMHDGTIDYTFLLDLYSYTAVAGTKDENEIYTSVSQTNAVNWQPITMDKKGILYYRNGATGGFVSTNKKIPAGEFHNIVFYHNPQNNTYSLYLDGECVAANVQALTSSIIASQTWVATEEAMRKTYGNYVKDSYFKDGLFTMDGAKAWTVGFVRFPQFNSHYKNAIDGNKIKLSEDGKTLTVNGEDFEVDGVKYAVSEPDNKGVRYAYTPTSYFREAEFFALDNVKVYYPKENVECAHSYNLSHTHDTANGVNKLTYSCKFCDKVISKDIAIGSYNDYSESGSILSADEIKSSGKEVVYAHEFAESGDGFSITDTWGMIKRVQDETTGNWYIKYGKTEKTGSSGSYSQVSHSKASSRDQALYNFNQYRGKSYVVSSDIMHYGNESFSLWEFIVYNAAPTYNADKTAITQTNSQSYRPVQIASNGALSLLDGKTGSPVPTGKTIKAGEFHNVTLHHFPKTNTYDFYLDGELIVKDRQMLTQSQMDSLTWTCSVLNTKYSDSKINYTDPEKKIMSVSYKDLMVGYIRFPQFNKALTKDILAIDNLKVYFSEQNLECKHKYTYSNVCDWCGYETTCTHCATCDGEAISENAAVVGKSVSLGQIIDINLYVKNANSKATSATLACADKNAAFDLSKLTPDEDGNYKLSLNLTSIDMARAVELSFGGGTYTTSVKEYAEELIATSKNANEIKLAKALLNFGAHAQVYFAERNNDASLLDLLANAGLSNADKTVNGLTAQELASHKLDATGESETFKFVEASFTLSSKTYLNIFFTASANAKVTVNGKYYGMVKVGDLYCTTVTIDTPALADQAFDVRITDGKAILTASISAYTAIESALSNPETDAKLAELLKAYTEYCECTKAFIA